MPAASSDSRRAGLGASLRALSVPAVAVFALACLGPPEKEHGMEEAKGTLPSDASAAVGPSTPRWGEGPDAFGDTPDADGYYSQRLHFDLESPDPIHRALVLLERDPDGSLHLRFSKQDIEKMPTVEEVLRPALDPTTGEPLDARSFEDPLRPHFEITRVEQGEDGPLAIERRLIPPVPGFELHLDGVDPDEDLRLQGVDSATGRVLWTDTSFPVPPDLVEFSESVLGRFIYFEELSGFAVFDLSQGRVCPSGVARLPRGRYARFPSFVNESQAVVFQVGESVLRLNLKDCEVQPIVKALVPARNPEALADFGFVSIEKDAGTVLLAAAEIQNAPVSPRGLRALQHLLLTYKMTPNGFVETHRVAARLVNSILGIESAGVEGLASPVMGLHLLRSRRFSPQTGQLEIDYAEADVCFLLITTAKGISAIRRPRDLGSSLVLNRARGWLRYDGRWWDLAPLAGREDDDVIAVGER